jgi:enoyl-CoA hydratase
LIDLGISEKIATITLNRPPVNGMNDEWVMRFHEVLDVLERRSDWNVALVRSALKVFCAGADLKQLRVRFEKPIEEQIQAGKRYQALFARIEKLPQATIAEIGGAALGGGLELAMACDLRIASSRAKLGLPEVGLGLLPGAGGTQRLTWLCGRAIALRMILAAETISGDEAARVGLINWAVEETHVAEEARSRAQRYASMPRHAVAAAKAAITAATNPGADGFAVETEGVRALLQSRETRDLVAAFLARTAQANS